MYEAEDLEDWFEELAKNATLGKIPDFDSHFQFLDGKYKSVTEYIPMKSYGNNRPFLLRIYTIKLQSNCYVITAGGIKLSKTIQDSPDLKDYVIQNMDRVRVWLISNGISDE